MSFFQSMPPMAPMPVMPLDQLAFTFTQSTTDGSLLEQPSPYQVKLLFRFLSSSHLSSYTSAFTLVAGVVVLSRRIHATLHRATVAAKHSANRPAAANRHPSSKPIAKYQHCDISAIHSTLAIAIAIGTWSCESKACTTIICFFNTARQRSQICSSQFCSSEQ